MNEIAIKSAFPKAGFISNPSAKNYEKEGGIAKKWGKHKEYGKICEDAYHENYLRNNNS